MTTRFKILVTQRNAAKWLPGCLESIESQRYANYSVIVMDDGSTDGSPEIIDQWRRETKDYYGLDVTSVFNSNSMGAMHNHVFAIRQYCDPEDVVVFVDGDDQLAHNDVLKVLDRYYSTGKYDMTYGSYVPVPMSKTCPKPRPYPADVIKNRTFRAHQEKHGIWFNHLRTVKAKLVLPLGDRNFRFPNGDWFPAGTDSAIMLPALEQAGERHTLIPEVLYHYNSENPNSDWRIHLKAIRKVDAYIYSLEPVA